MVLPVSLAHLMAKFYQLYTLRVQIRDINPPIWRRVRVEGFESLRKLHHILQAAFGWTASHLHEFEIDDKTYAMFDLDDVLDSMDPDNTFDDRKTRLQKVAYPGVSFLYKYDFGDGWEHDIVVEKIEPIECEPDGCAHILAGARACPPEDVGGPFGYQGFLDTLRERPDSEEAKDYRRWVGEDFDAELFDRRAANATLLRMAWNRWGGK
ncbi:plasmid pRiA4b ORF-3 family protein [Paraburkholderia sediminicola]